MTITLQIENYERKYRDDILTLMFFSKHTHTHLDWYKVGQWLDLYGDIVQLAFDKDMLIGVLGMGDPLNRTTWLRLTIVAEGYDPALVLGFLWEQMRVRLMREQMTKVGVLVINPWLAQYLPALGFQYHEDVITMHRAPQNIPSEPTTPVEIRNGYIEDVRAIVAIDHAAFVPPWQMNATDIRLSQRQAASCLVATYQDEIVAYQIATRHHKSGHLARLAVHPKIQGKRVGQLLLHHLLTRFEKRGVRGMTVNTQRSNIRSQRLYERFGFIRNGFDLPMWQFEL